MTQARANPSTQEHISNLNQSRQWNEETGFSFLEMSQSVMCFPAKHADVSLDPGTCGKAWHVYVCVCSLSAVGCRPGALASQSRQNYEWQFH